MNKISFVVYDIEFDEVGIKQGSKNISPNNQFSDLEEAKKYAINQKTKGIKYQLIYSYDSSNQKIIEIIQ